MNQSKLLSLNSYHYRRGGSDVMYFKHSELFQSHGWETASFSMHHPNNDSSSWSQYFIDELEFGSDYGLFDKLTMASKVIYSREAFKKIERLVNNWRPDIAHAHCIYHHLSPSVLGALKDHDIPTVMTAHDLKLACPAYKMLNSGGICEKCKGGNVLHVAINRCLHESLSVSLLVMVESAIHKLLGLYRKNLDKIVVPSHFFGNKLKEWGWAEDKLVYIPNNVAAEDFQPVYMAGGYLLYFGRLAPEKGLFTLLKAVAKTGVKLHLVGTGPIEKELKAFSEKIKCNAVFHGFCKKEAFIPLVHGARATVLPSEWYENAPMSVLESHALGKIVIGADIGGIPELIKSGETGFLFESANADQLSERITSVFALPDTEIEAMGRNARQYVAENFTAEKYFESMLELYKSLR